MQSNQEIWRDVLGYEGAYEVSNLGRVRSLDRFGSDGRRVSGRVMSPGRHHRDRHRQVKLCQDGVVKNMLVHRLVLEAFVGPCPDGMVACHWDDDPDNNALDNLRWGTLVENARDALRNSKCAGANLTHCVRGHEFAGSNLRTDSGGRRRCLSCLRAWSYVKAHNLPSVAVDTVAARFYDEIRIDGAFLRRRRGRQWFDSIAPPQSATADA